MCKSCSLLNTYIIIYCDPNQVGQQDIQSLVRTLGLDYQLEEEDIQDILRVVLCSD